MWQCGFRVTVTEAGRVGWPVYNQMLEARIGDPFTIAKHATAVALPARRGRSISMIIEIAFADAGAAC